MWFGCDDGISTNITEPSSPDTVYVVDTIQSVYRLSFTIDSTTEQYVDLIDSAEQYQQPGFFSIITRGHYVCRWDNPVINDNWGFKVDHVGINSSSASCVTMYTAYKSLYCGPDYNATYIGWDRSRTITPIFDSTSVTIFYKTHQHSDQDVDMFTFGSWDIAIELTRPF